jgi:hypothetical protein
VRNSTNKRKQYINKVICQLNCNHAVLLETPKDEIHQFTSQAEKNS